MSSGLRVVQYLKTLAAGLARKYSFAQSVLLLYNFLKEVISSNILVVRMLLKRVTLFFPFSFWLVQMNIRFLEMSAIWAEVTMTVILKPIPVRWDCTAQCVLVNGEEQLSAPAVRADF